ncbi:lipid IV(A) 3-deoxy-D-manno-octulosonic acid transferase [Cellvibrio sp. OA-2007]|uniref:lipid IV(A) 3-deoxy-D-manno-octulosonic acid transferase n=1 Tax=Cellvibrio sp. OA-2007 TaxID=529823 RepID=UPI00078431E6|nr:lipid IV(A) 3-deoxy-D-manno-octulosonic acid transferase [Cellvibrio sp. OA-2007]
MRILYSLIFYLILPVILLRLLWRSLAAPAYAKRWAERFGYFPALTTRKKVVWLHTVSVGEFLAALPMIRRLQADEAIQLVITTTTPTGSERVRATLGDSVFHVYAPYDLPDVLMRFLHRIKPSVYLVMETELWPNTLAACAKRNIPTVLVNGRLSEKSARGYARFGALTKPMLQNLSCAAIQNATDASRFIALGLSAQNVRVTGNIKFDLKLSDDLREQAMMLKRQLSNAGQRLIFIAASTHQGEDEIILDAFARVRASSPELTRAVLVLVPRHPERFERVGQLCVARGFNTALRSESGWSDENDILLGNTMGELLLLFGASDVAFVGGSLVPNGGHNFIEPAAWGLPLISGESLFNFAEVSTLLIKADALDVVHNTEALTACLHRLLLDANERARKGKNGLRVAIANRGALDKTLAIINAYIK